MRYTVEPGNKVRVVAADDNPGFGDEPNFEGDLSMEDTDGFSDDLNELSDSVDDLQDAVEDDGGPADTILDIHNNIENHYIAECQNCHEIFISAMVESDSPVQSIHGECPVCHEETDQDLKWIVRDLNYGKDDNDI